MGLSAPAGHRGEPFPEAPRAVEAGTSLGYVSSIRHRSKVLSSLSAVASAAAVPFFATGLFRLNAPTAVVVLLLLASAAALATVPRHGRWLAAGWLVGVALYTAFLLWLFAALATPRDW
jgi:hypothetical protein